jgi:HAD superfamily hydrolase (TIGR01490 family)
VIGARAAAVFDVDGTVCDTRCTSCRALLLLRERQHAPWRHRLWLASLGWRLPLLWLTDRVSRDASDRQVYRQYAGLSERLAIEDARDRCRTLLLSICFPDALAEIAAHQAAGRRVVLVSGGLDLVLAPLAQALGAELLAQRLVTADGRLTGEHRGYAVLDHQTGAATQAARKAAALACYAERTGIDLAASFGYGDSMNDLMMLELVGTPTAVRPDRRLAKVARARGWAIRHWAAGSPATAEAR